MTFEGTLKNTVQWLTKKLTCSGSLPASVAQLKVFPAWGALFKNKTWLSQGSFIHLQQVKETRDSSAKLCIPEGRFSIAYIHYSVNNMLISFFAVGYFHLVEFLSADPVYSCSTKYCATF